MPDLPSADEIIKLTGVLAPGIIILWIRRRFKDAALPAFSEQILSYSVVSVAYNAVSYPIFHAGGWIELQLWFWQFLLYFCVPLIVGIALVFFDQSEGFYKLTDRVGLRPVHHTPTAWDYTFRRREPSYAIVHLADGSSVAGAWVDGSFASSTAGDRDVLISQMWRVGDDGLWAKVEPARSILICGGGIQMIEFIKGGQE